MNWKGGPAKWGKNVINPQKTMVTQAIETHIDVLTATSHGQRHGHMNSAVFYILEGKGYDVHDGVKLPWKAGDVCIVENMCVHQHFNADQKKPARYVIFKAKPTFIFFHLVFQRIVELPPTEVPGFEHFHPEP
jgi:mannose-6-phosphate isomerase-like protein (cupin superfamily)